MLFVCRLKALNAYHWLGLPLSLEGISGWLTKKGE
jgi:hypothetical protein